MDQKDDTNKDKKEDNIISIPLGGAESMPQSVELSKTVESSESLEVQKGKENIVFGEKAKEQATERQVPSIPPQQAVQTPKVVKKEDKKELPVVYGYKIPPQIQNNLKTVKSGVGSGDPKNGMTWLKVFIDRLLKMG
ncbi:hypothetical protein KBD45_04275 [Candidatus Dojkabacteria bacterium]|nr:hypothetical protein [Candidatus Dojkabacteria bacterium]